MGVVSVDQLIEGCITAKDVYSKSNYPIIKEKTVLNKKHLEILKTFLISEIEVEPSLQNGERFISKKRPVVKENEEKIEVEPDFVSLFLKAAKDFKREFNSWQAGMSVDVTKIRAIMIPLIENEKFDLMSLHQYTSKENYIYQHCVAIGLLSGFIARKFDYTKGDILQVAIAGCLANCGMAKIDPRILNKKTSLTREEFEEIKEHPIYSYKMIEKTPLLKDEAKLAIIQHHERLDGSGYPSREKGNLIHHFARIIAVSEVFHAMTSERLYKNKRSPFRVIEKMREDFFGQFDVVVLEKLSTSILTFSRGSKVRLSDGRIAEIMFIDYKNPARPLVKILDSEEIVQLVEARHLSIEKVLD